MRTITFNVYKFDELGAKAQEKAVELMSGPIGERSSEFDSDEYRACLNDIEDAFGIKVYDWSVGYPGTYHRWRFTSDRWEGVAREGAKYLFRYLRHVTRWLDSKRRKTYRTLYRQMPDGRYTCKERKSRIMFYDYYELSGTWCDHAVDHALQTAYDQARRGCDIEDFINNMLHNFFHDWEEDIEYNYGPEHVREELLENSYEFYADGRPFS